MAKATTQTLTVQSIERLGHSANGNPSFTVVFTSGLVARTQTDASMVYGIENPEYRGVPLTVHFTGAGRISYWEVAK